MLGEIQEVGLEAVERLERDCNPLRLSGLGDFPQRFDAAFPLGLPLVLLEIALAEQLGVDRAAEHLAAELGERADHRLHELDTAAAGLGVRAGDVAIRREKGADAGREAGVLETLSDVIDAERRLRGKEPKFDDVEA